MSRRITPYLILVSAALLAVSACSPAAPPPATQPAPAPTKAAEPTKPAATQPAPTVVPTAVPTKAAAFPPSGANISFIVPWPAGGSNDVSGRFLAPILSKNLGTNVEILNLGGASSQVGMTELVTRKADGLTLGQVSLPTLSTVYLQADRKAVFDRKSFEPIGQQSEDASVIAVLADSPYKTLKDVIDDAKANPNKVTMGSDPWLNFHQLTVAQLEKAAGVTFASVQFNGSAQKQTALLGGHIAVAATSVADVTPLVQNGSVRVLATAGTSESAFLPGVKTVKSLGYDVTSIASRGFALRAGTPKDVVNVWSEALRKSINDPEFIEKMKGAGQEVKYLAPAEYGTYWDGVDTQIQKMIAEGAPKTSS